MKRLIRRFWGSSIKSPVFTVLIIVTLLCFIYLFIFLLSDSSSNAALMISSAVNKYPSAFGCKARTETGSARPPWPQLGRIVSGNRRADINPRWKSSIYRINSSRSGPSLWIHWSSHHMDELVSSAEHEGWRPSCSCAALIGCESVLYDYKAPNSWRWAPQNEQ